MRKNPIDTYILGLSCYYHDSAAALIKNGEIIAAVQEERFTRKKHDSSYPFNAVEFVLNYSNLKLNEVDQLLLNSQYKLISILSDKLNSIN